MNLEINVTDYLDIYKNYSDYFSKFNVLSDLLRSLGWLILKGLILLENQTSKLLDIIFDFINFLDSDSVNNFYLTIKPFVFTVLLFALIYMSYCYIFAHEKPKGVITNIFIFAGVMLILPFFMVQMNNLVRYGKEALDISQSGSGYSLLDPYITDLCYLDSIDFNQDIIQAGTTNGFDQTNSDNIKYLDINEVLDPGDYVLNNSQLFQQELSSSIENGKDTIGVSDIKKSKFFFKDTTPYYYRYHVNFFIAMLYLLALILVMVFSSFKLVQLIYELAAEKILAPFIAAGDFTNGQKIRKALIGILNAYITILCVLLLQKIFLLATVYINTKKWSDNIAMNGLVKVILILAGALFIVDGPNFFEQIFGIDAGLKSVGQALQSAYYSSQMLGGAMSTVKGVAAKTGNVAKAPGQFVRGAANASRKAIGAATKAAGAVAGAKDTGVFASNNEMVQEKMAKTSLNNQDKTSMHHSNALKENSSVSQAMEEQSSLLNKNDTSVANENMSAEKSIQPESAKPEAQKKGLENQNTSINQAVNDELNHRTAPPKDTNNLVGWAKDNTKTGQYLSQQYDSGKKLGHAVGNTVNDLQRQQQSASGGTPVAPTYHTVDDNKDKLKG